MCPTDFNFHFSKILRRLLCSIIYFRICSFASRWNSSIAPHLMLLHLSPFLHSLSTSHILLIDINVSTDLLEREIIIEVVIKWWILSIRSENILQVCLLKRSPCSPRKLKWRTLNQARHFFNLRKMSWAPIFLRPRADEMESGHFCHLRGISWRSVTVTLHAGHRQEEPTQSQLHHLPKHLQIYEIV